MGCSEAEMIFLGCLKISWTDPPVCLSAECPPGVCADEFLQKVKQLPTAESSLIENFLTFCTLLNVNLAINATAATGEGFFSWQGVLRHGFDQISRKNVSKPSKVLPRKLELTVCTNHNRCEQIR